MTAQASGPARALRALLAALALALLGPAAGRADPVAVDHLGLPGPYTLAGEAYRLVWSSKPTPAYAKHEYLPEFQTTERYERMLLIEHAAGLDPARAATAKVAELDARKAQDAAVTHAIRRLAASGEILLVFTLSARRAGERVFEWNAYRYAPGPAGGVTLLGFSRRAYGDAAGRDFLRSMRSGRPADVRALLKLPMPQPRAN